MPPRLPDPRSGLVLDTHDLSRRAGRLLEVTRVAPAPDELGIEVIGVPPGSPVDLDLRLESVVEGVLVTGTAVVRLRGTCARCLEEIADTDEVDIQELFCYCLLYTSISTPTPSSAVRTSTRGVSRRTIRSSTRSAPSWRR